jgi:hypothetical protein
MTQEVVLAAVRANPGRYLRQQLGARGVPFGTREQETAVLKAVSELLDQGELRRAGTTPHEPLACG